MGSTLRQNQPHRPRKIRLRLDDFHRHFLVLKFQRAICKDLYNGVKLPGTESCSNRVRPLRIEASCFMRPVK